MFSDKRTLDKVEGSIDETTGGVVTTIAKGCIWLCWVAG